MAIHLLEQIGFEFLQIGFGSEVLVAPSSLLRRPSGVAIVCTPYLFAFIE